MKRGWVVLAGLVVGTISLALLGSVVLSRGVAIENRLEWHARGIWLEGDAHTHNLLNPMQGSGILDVAERRGLDFVAATDHAQSAFDDQSVDRLRKLRETHPGLIVLAGVEWNIPAGDHATVLIEQGPDEIDVLEAFGRKFDRKINPDLLSRRPAKGSASWGELDQAIAGLRWLDQRERFGASAVYLNHLCRKGDFDLADIAELHEAGLDGIESAPGHQKRAHPGEYCTVDRHDPFVAIGEGYDRLAAGERHLGVSAGSDFHHPGSAFFPGEFSRTFVYAPERSSRGVIDGLSAGATVTVLGGIADAVETRAIAGNGEYALVGETLVVPVGAKVRYSLRLNVPALDAFAQPNRIDRVEIISDLHGKPHRVWIFGDIEPGERTLDLDLPEQVTSKPGSFYLRALGRRFVGDDRQDAVNADFQFHTAPTRIRVVNRSIGRQLAAFFWPWS